jgi:hypothetical protein
MDSANTSALSAHMIKHGVTKHELMLMFRGFNAYAEAFRRESDSHE